MDYQLFHLLNQLAGRFDGADDLFERIATTGPFVLVAMLIGMWFWPGHSEERDDRQWACIAAVISASVALGLNQIIIRLWARPRPFDSHQVVLLLKPSHDPSFPSDHATFAFAVAVSILLVSRRIGTWALVVAAVLSVSRVYVGEHYFGDVIAGAGIGTGMAYAVNLTRSILMPLLKGPMILAAESIWLDPPTMRIAASV